MTAQISSQNSSNKGKIVGCEARMAAFTKSAPETNIKIFPRL